ncbi:hypothetical protein BLNAU_6240 [Blattamonas nauphoetae]|uniref:Uncharacterized protein n=1 Tax=Blattamonas nauphoetae TaxID=2049346 RepID=A0ABQ9Y4R3_9EUKA|nr:hypothetical protein BLNAU_6240 [Blattamonas nauphoetae]
MRFGWQPLQRKQLCRTSREKNEDTEDYLYDDQCEEMISDDDPEAQDDDGEVEEQDSVEEEGHELDDEKNEELDEEQTGSEMSESEHEGFEDNLKEYTEETEDEGEVDLDPSIQPENKKI